MGRGKHCSEEKKNQIRCLRSRGVTYRKICELLQCSQSSIGNALTKISGMETRGRKKTTTMRTERMVTSLSKRQPEQTSNDIKRELDLDVSARTVRRILVRNGLHGRSARRVPHITKQNVEKRIKFANEHIFCSEKKWRNVLWSDETKINLFGGDGKKYVRRPENQEWNPKYTKKTVKHGGGNIMIWGCFSWYGVGPLHMIQNDKHGNANIMDSAYYRNILRTKMLPFAEWNMPLKWRFQQDNDPKHTAGKTSKWMKNRKIEVLPWPSQSPDLNPIENLWAHVKSELVKRGKPSNRHDLWIMVQEVWKSIPVSYCQKLVESMPRRCGETLRNKGYSTKY